MITMTVDHRTLFGVRKIVIGFVLGTLLSAHAWASPEQLKEGNRLFKNGSYDKALKSYNDALIDAPHSSILHFNAGDAAYQTGDLDKAIQSFQEASESGIPVLKAAAHYNRGNALYRQQKWADAVEAYKESLRVNPQDQDAKYNLGVAMRTMQHPPSPSQSPPKSGSGKEGDKSKGGGQDSKDKNQGDGASQAPQQGKMSREDADRLLAAAGAGEMKKSNQKYPKSDLPHPDEDW